MFSPYTVAFLVLIVLALGFGVRAIRGYDMRNFEMLFASLGWMCWAVGIIWIGASLMELSGRLILSSYTNFSDRVFLMPFIVGALPMATSGALILRRMFKNWRERERDQAALPRVESLEYGHMPGGPRH